VAAAMYTVEEVTARLQITSRTLHYYEEIGLIPPAARTAGGHRMYDQAVLERLEHILRIKTALGASLQDISAILAAEENLEQLRAQYRGEDVSGEEKQRILQQGAELLTSLVVSIDEKIERLSKLRESFRERLNNVNRRRQEQEEQAGETPPS